MHSFARARPYCAQEMRTMRMSNEEYAAFVDSLSPRSPIWGDLLRGWSAARFAWSVRHW